MWCVIGAEGQLGSDMAAVAEEESDLKVEKLSRSDVDVTDPTLVRETLKSHHPSVVINCAAFHNVDLCEDDPARAFAVNAIGPLNVARTCRELDTKHVFISTDFVFDGGKSGPYSEEDSPQPLNVYGVSKLAGEILVRQQDLKQSLVVRTASLFGRAPPSGKDKNFVQAILERARAGKELRVIDDITMSPTFTRHLASAIVALVRADAVGIFHVANRGMCTWLEFAQQILEQSGIDEIIEPVSQSAFASKAVRPRNSALDTNKVSSYWEPPTWQVALQEYLEEIA